MGAESPGPKALIPAGNRRLNGCQRDVRTTRACSAACPTASSTAVSTRKRSRRSRPTPEGQCGTGRPMPGTHPDAGRGPHRRSARAHGMTVMGQRVGLPQIHVPTEARYYRVFHIIKGEAGGSCHCGRVLAFRCSTSSSPSGNSASRDTCGSAGASSVSSNSASISISDLTQRLVQIPGRRVDPLPHGGLGSAGSGSSRMMVGAAEPLRHALDFNRGIHASRSWLNPTDSALPLRADCGCLARGLSPHGRRRRPPLRSRRNSG
jgi:hypothetical protein